MLMAMSAVAQSKKCLSGWNTSLWQDNRQWLNYVEKMAEKNHGTCHFLVSAMKTGVAAAICALNTMRIYIVVIRLMCVNMETRKSIKLPVGPMWTITTGQKR